MSIGVNDGWIYNSYGDTIINLINYKYPLAKKYIVNGEYGWGLNQVTIINTSANWNNLIAGYITHFTNNNYTILGDITQLSSHPSTNDIFYKSVYRDMKKYGLAT